MATLGEYIGAGSGTTKLLLHLNGNSTDSSGNGNNGTDTNITYVDGKFGKCASFNGSSSYINVSTNLYALTDYTVSAWIKTTYTGPNQLQIYEQKNTADNASLDFVIYQGKAQSSAWNGSTSPAVFSISNVNDGNWHLVMTTRSGSTLKIYVDGAYENQNTSANTVTIGTNDGRIGRHPIYTSYFNGSIDEVIVENRAWSAEEVKKYYTQSKGFFATI